MSKILILSSNPRRDLNLEREVSDLTTAVQRLGKFEIRLGLGVRSQELPDLLTEHSPEFVHFCGHGAGEQGLVFQDENGRERVISTEILSRIFNTFADEINCVVLNACDSYHQAQAIVQHINYVVGIRQLILDQAAFTFAVGFYKGLAHGKSIETSYELGRIAIQLSCSKSSNSNKDRKAEYDGEVTQSAEPNLQEYEKPVLLKRIAADSSSPLPGLPEGFEKFVRQEIERKEYKDQARAAYDNFGQFSARNCASVTISNLDDEQRKILLNKVKEFWIEGFLKPSIKPVFDVNPNMILRHELIDNLEQGTESLPVKLLDNSFDELIKTRIYEEIGQGRTLLILGEPGAGKTIALLKKAQHLIEYSENNPSLSIIPVVFNLSSWSKDQKEIFNWLIDELREKYQVPKSLSKRWIKEQQLTLLLDGLDEVKEDYRNDCVDALNKFLEDYPQTEVAVCSRVQDYEALEKRLKISSAICLQPFSLEQVNQFLSSFGGLLTGLIALLNQHPELQQFAKNPLILNFMSVAYQGWSGRDLMTELFPIEKRKQRLFNSYIKRKLNRVPASEYNNNDVQRWLNWLAIQMVQEKQTIFLIENIQPTYLIGVESSLNVIKLIYCIGVMFIIYLVTGLLFIPTILNYGLKDKFGLLNVSILIPFALVCYGLISSLGFIFIHDWIDKKVLYSNSEISNQPLSDNQIIINSLINGSIFGLITSSIYGIIIDVFTGYSWLRSSLFIYPLFSTILAWIIEIINLEILEIKPVGILDPAPTKIKINLFFVIMFILLFSVAYQIRNLIVWQSLDWDSLGKLLLVFVPIGICFIIFNAFEISTNIKKESTKPNQGIWDSAKNTFFYMTRVIPIGVIIGYTWANVTKFIRADIGLMYGIIFGLIGSILIFGQGSGIACIKHFILRVILCINKHIPWDYAKFLDFASERELMKKIGGGYVFFHRMLLEHFASNEFTI